MPTFNENLEVISCDFNLIRELPEFNKNLKKINCESNQITNLQNWDKIRELEEFNCSFNLTLQPIILFQNGSYSEDYYPGRNVSRRETEEYIISIHKYLSTSVQNTK